MHYTIYICPCQSLIKNFYNYLSKSSSSWTHKQGHLLFCNVVKAYRKQKLTEPEKEWVAGAYYLWSEVKVGTDKLESVNFASVPCAVEIYAFFEVWAERNK